MRERPSAMPRARIPIEREGGSLVIALLGELPLPLLFLKARSRVASCLMLFLGVAIGCLGCCREGKPALGATPDLEAPAFGLGPWWFFLLVLPALPGLSPMVLSFLDSAQEELVLCLICY